MPRRFFILGCGVSRGHGPSVFTRSSIVERACERAMIRPIENLGRREGKEEETRRRRGPHLRGAIFEAHAAFYAPIILSAACASSII